MRAFYLAGCLAGYLACSLVLMCSVAMGSESEPVPAPTPEAPAEPGAPSAKFPVKDRDPSNPFGQVRTPTTGKIEVIGGYALGCIAGASRMPVSGKGWEIVRVSRHRMFGHSILLNLLKRAASERESQRSAPQSPMIIGDMSQPRGGPMTSGHTSHQTGLDADIWLQTLPPGTKMTDELRETLPLTTVLAADYKSVDPQKWNDAYGRQIIWFAGQPEVDRIFANAAIKKKLCALFPGDERLKKVRPWYAHDAHFHVRLGCPSDQPGCVPQKPVEGIDCEDKHFTYWFSDSVIAALKNPPPPRPAKTVYLPVECRDIVRAP